CPRNVRILEYDVTVGASELEDRFLQQCSGSRGDRLAGTDTPGEGDRCNARVLDQRLYLLRADQDGAKQIPREPGLPEDLLERERTTRDVRGMLEDAAVSRHQVWSAEAHCLPEREVPRHHREHHAEWIESNERFGSWPVAALTIAQVLQARREEFL